MAFLASFEQLLDANTVMYLPFQEALTTAQLAELAGYSLNIDDVNGSPTAREAGPRANIYSRRTAGQDPGGASWAGLGSNGSVVDLAMRGDATTVELIVRPVDYASYSGVHTARTLFAYGVDSSPVMLLYWYPQLSGGQTGGLWLAATGQSGQYGFETRPTPGGSGTLVENAWYYICIRKWTTSGTTPADKLCTWDAYYQRLDESWVSPTPTVTATGKPINVPVSTSRYWSFGTRTFTGPIYSNGGRWCFAGFRVSNVVRSLEQMKVMFDYYAGTQAPSATPSPIASYVPASYEESTVDFGEDVSVFPTLSGSLALVSGRRVLGEALLKRFTTRRGQLPFHPDYGFYVQDYLHDGVTAEQLYFLKASIEAEAEKDERVDLANAILTFNQAEQKLTVQLEVQTQEGPFRFTLSITELTTALLEDS